MAALGKPAWHNWLASTDGDLAAEMVESKVDPLEVHLKNKKKLQIKVMKLNIHFYDIILTVLFEVMVE